MNSPKDPANVPRVLNPKALRIGDRIRIVGIPGEGVPGYYMHSDTRRAYKKFIARGRSVRISFIREDGYPWFDFRLRRKDGRWE